MVFSPQALNPRIHFRIRISIGWNRHSFMLIQPLFGFLVSCKLDSKYNSLDFTQLKSNPRLCIQMFWMNSLLFNFARANIFILSFMLVNRTVNKLGFHHYILQPETPDAKRVVRRIRCFVSRDPLSAAPNLTFVRLI